MVIVYVAQHNMAIISLGVPQNWKIYILCRVVALIVIVFILISQSYDIGPSG